MGDVRDGDTVPVGKSHEKGDEALLNMILSYRH